MTDEPFPLASRRKTRPVHVGDVQVGGDAPIVVQTMTNTDTADAKATVEQIARLADEGAEIVRVAVPDKRAAEALPDIVKATPVPLIADIHFDHRLALASIAAGIHGLRLNPGNIRDAGKVREVVQAAKERGISIRIGVNEGSLPPIPALADGELPPPKTQRMVDAALWEIGILEEMGFEDIKLSLKAFDVPTMVTAYREIAKRVPYPLHLGVTEAGLPGAGTVRSSVGIGVLLAEGIGDTIRVSLAADPVEELPVCWDILKSLNLRQRGRHDRRLPDLRPHRGRSHPARPAGRGALQGARQADHRRGHGLRRQRPRRIARRRRRPRRRQRQGRDLPQRRSRPHRPRGRVLHRAPRRRPQSDRRALRRRRAAMATASSVGEEVIGLTPIEASPTLPGRAARRG